VTAAAPDPLAGRQARLLRVLRAATLLAAALAAIGVVVEAVAVAAVAVLVAAPLVRVAWLANRWRRRGDPRFSFTAVGLLALVALGTVLAAATS
jgi:hypothetical protein